MSSSSSSSISPPVPSSPPLPSSPTNYRLRAGKVEDQQKMKELIKMKDLSISSSKSSSPQLEINDIVDDDDDDELAVTAAYSSSDDSDDDQSSVGQYSDSVDQYYSSSVVFDDVDPNLKAAKKVTATGKKESTKKKGKKDMRLGKQNKHTGFGNRKSSLYYSGELD